MSKLAPARKADMQMLVGRRDNAKTPREHAKYQRAIDNLIAEGKDSRICAFRHRLLGATKNGDLAEADRISAQIKAYQRRKGK